VTDVDPGPDPTRPLPDMITLTSEWAQAIHAAGLDRPIELNEPARNGSAPDVEPDLEVQTWRQFAATAGDHLPLLVDDLWPEGALGFIASPPKAGKTWLGLSLAVSLATGSDYLAAFRVAAPVPVLYVALEGHRSAIRARLGCLLRGVNADPDADVDRLHVCYKPSGIDIGEVSWARRLRGAAAAVGARLLVVDVLRAAAPSLRENEAASFAALRANLQPLLDDGVSLALLHHFGKLNEVSRERRPAERMAGSGAMYGALDVGVYITGSDRDARSLRVEFDTRDIRQPGMIGVVLEGEGTGPGGGFTFTDRAWWRPAVVPSADDIAASPETIAQTVLGHDGDLPEPELARMLGVAARTVARRRATVAARLWQLGVTWRGGGDTRQQVVWCPRHDDDDDRQGVL
jgi:hypothetical protein